MIFIDRKCLQISNSNLSTHKANLNPFLSNRYMREFHQSFPVSFNNFVGNTWLFCLGTRSLSNSVPYPSFPANYLPRFSPVYYSGQDWLYGYAYHSMRFYVDMDLVTVVAPINSIIFLSFSLVCLLFSQKGLS